MRETWYVMEDGSCGDPREIAPDTAGILRHNDGRAVAYAPHGPRSRGVDVGEVDRGRDMRPAQTGPGYLTRETRPGRIDPFDHDGDGRAGGSAKPESSGDIASLRAEYQAAFGKRPFPGWDAATLSEKIAAHKAKVD